MSDQPLQENQASTSFNFDKKMLSMMTVEMRWHFRGSSEEGVESVDFHPSYGDESDNGDVLGRFCTAGLDGVVRIWEIPHGTEERIQQAFVEKTSHDYSFIRLVASLERTGTTDEFSCFTCRWSPCGQLIASCYSDGVVEIWCHDTVESAKLAQDQEARMDGSEKWRIVNTFRGPQSQISEIPDVAFTRDSSQVCFVCNSGVMMMYPVGKRAHGMQTFANPEDHQANALGIAMDPLGLLFGTTGSDTRLRFYDATGLMQRTNNQNLHGWVLSKAAQQNPQGVQEAGVCLDAILGHAGGPFFRRSSWSPDGGMAAFPFGRVYSYQSQTMRDQQQKQQQQGGAGNNDNENDNDDADNDMMSDSEENNNNSQLSANGQQQMMMMGSSPSPSSAINKNLESKYPGTAATAIAAPTGSDCVTSSVVFVLRSKLNRVAAALTIKDTTAVAGCRFAPKIFEAIKEDTEDPERAKSKGSWGPLTYRYAIAVWTSGTVMVFTSDCSFRHSSFTNLHYAKINDVAWTPRCKILAVASEDQTVSLISLADTLGQTVSLRTIREQIPPHLCPPLVLIASTMLEIMDKCAQENEAVVLSQVNQNKPANTKVVIKKKRRTRDDTTTAVDGTDASAAAAKDNNSNTNNNQATTSVNADGQAAPPQQQQPPEETANEDDLMAALG